MSNPTEIKPNWDDVQLDAKPGAYSATCKKAVHKFTNENHHHMLVVEWVLESDADGNAPEDGSYKVTDFIVFFPPGHRAYKTGVKKIQTFCKALGLTTKSLPEPSKLADATAEDFTDFAAEVTGCQATVKVSVQAAKDNAEPRLRINY